MSGISGFKRSEFGGLSNNLLSKSSSSDGISLADSTSNDFSVVFSDDWLFVFLDNVIRLWLNILNSLDFVGVLLKVFNMLNWDRSLFNVVDVFYGYWWLFNVVNMLNGDWWLRNVVDMRNSISWGLNPINVFNGSSWWLDVVNIFNRVSWWYNILVVRNGIRSLGNVFHMVNGISWRNNSLEPFLRNRLRDNLFNVLDGDWFWLDPFDVFNGNIFNSSDRVRSLRYPFSPFNIVWFRLKPFDVRNLV